MEVLPGPDGADDVWHPLSGTQLGLWFFHQVAPQCPAYHLPLAVDVVGPFDPDGFVARLHEAVARHPILRSCFPVIGGLPVVCVRAAAAPITVVEDAGGWSDGQVEEALARDATAPFDLADGPLVRLRILRRGPERHVIVLCLHHAVADLASMSLLLRELIEGPGDDPEASYAAFARTRGAALEGPSADEAWTHWEEQLDGADWDLPLPLDFPPAGAHRARGAHPPVRGPPATGGRPRAGRRGARRHAVLAAAAVVRGPPGALLRPRRPAPGLPRLGAVRAPLRAHPGAVRRCGPPARAGRSGPPLRSAPAPDARHRGGRAAARGGPVRDAGPSARSPLRRAADLDPARRVRLAEPRPGGAGGPPRAGRGGAGPARRVRRRAVDASTAGDRGGGVRPVGHGVPVRSGHRRRPRVPQRPLRAVGHRPPRRELGGAARGHRRGAGGAARGHRSRANEAARAARPGSAARLR